MKSAIHLAFAAAISCAALVSSAEVKPDPARQHGYSRRGARAATRWTV